MLLTGKLQFNYLGDSFTFRSIFPEEVCPSYIEGLMRNNPYLENVPTPIDHSSQQQYISRIIDSKADTICGLFLEDELIGTAGIQNLQVQGTNVTVGIFVFDPLNRGKGYGKVLVWAACRLAIDDMDIAAFWGGMKQENVRSYKSSISCGAVATHDSQRGSYRLTMPASDLTLLPGVTKVEFTPTAYKVV